MTEAAVPENFDVAELGGLAALTGNPVPALSRALMERVPRTVAGTVHRGATSQDIVDTAAMLMAARALDVIMADLGAAAQAAPLRSRCGTGPRSWSAGRSSSRPFP